jgi:branched-subunit amino acid transport protein
MSAATVVLLGLAAGTYGLKSAAPLLLGERALPGWVARLADLLPAALLAALVAVSTFTQNGTLAVDARLAGMAAAAVALLLRAPFVVVVLAAIVVTALTRLA